MVFFPLSRRATRVVRGADGECAIGEGHATGGDARRNTRHNYVYLKLAYFRSSDKTYTSTFSDRR